MQYLASDIISIKVYPTIDRLNSWTVPSVWKAMLYRIYVFCLKRVKTRVGIVKEALACKKDAWQANDQSSKQEAGKVFAAWNSFSIHQILLKRGFEKDDRRSQRKTG